MRDITKSSPEGGRSGWDDVGGLVDIRNAIKEACYLSTQLIFLKFIYLFCNGISVLHNIFYTFYV